MFDLTRDNVLAAVQSGDWELRAYLRAVFRRSLYASTKVATCYFIPDDKNFMSSRSFKGSCDWIQWVITTKKRGLLEDPRGMIKSTRVARGVPEWLAIQVPHEHWDFPAEYDRAMRFIDDHPHLRGPDSRLIVGCDSKERAAKFVGSSKADWENNPILRFIAPELIWDNTSRIAYGKWQNTEYTLNGRRNPALPDPFMAAAGIDSKIQGGRADGIIIDDLVGETSYKSIGELERRRDWVRTAPFLLENRDFEHPDGGFVIYDGNRWARDDVNSMLQNEFKDWAIWHRGGFKCIVHGFDNCGRWADSDEEDRQCAPSTETIWPERYPDEAALRRVCSDLGEGGTAEEIFAAQILNDPSAAAELDIAKVRSFRTEPTTIIADSGQALRAWAAVIPVLGADERVESYEKIPLSALTEHLISIDPADSKDPKNARTAISWFAYDRPTGRVFWIDCRADHWSADEAVDAAYALYVEAEKKLRQRPRVVIEKVACQGYFGAALRRAAHHDPRGRQFIPNPEMIPPARGLNKDDRIRRRTGYRLGLGLLYICSGLPLPRWEIRHFPSGTKDALDTHAQAEEIYLEITTGTNSDDLARARMRRRRRRRAAATRTGVPL
jgi:hypothetical protein